MTRLSDLVDFEKPDDNGAAMYRWLLIGFIMLSIAAIVIALTRAHASISSVYMIAAATATITLSAAGYLGLARIRRFWLFGVPGIPFSFLIHSFGIPTHTAIILGTMFGLGAIASLVLRGRFSTERIKHKR